MSWPVVTVARHRATIFPCGDRYVCHPLLQAGRYTLYVLLGEYESYAYCMYSMHTSLVEYIHTS